MPHVQNTAVCPSCGEEYWYEFDCRTGEVTKLSMCACDRWIEDAKLFLKEKGLLDEFNKFHQEREQELKARQEDSLKREESS